MAGRQNGLMHDGYSTLPEGRDTDALLFRLLRPGTDQSGYHASPAYSTDLQAAITAVNFPQHGLLFELNRGSGEPGLGWHCRLTLSTLGGLQHWASWAPSPALSVTRALITWLQNGAHYRPEKSELDEAREALCLADQLVNAIEDWQDTEDSESTFEGTVRPALTAYNIARRTQTRAEDRS